MILYLHGFRSSPQSYKARLMAAALAERGQSDQWWCPQLPASPRAAMEQALARAQAWLSAGGRCEDLVVVGSSLGGFYATWLAERVHCRAIVLNPVVHAARDLATQVGTHRTYHGDAIFEFLPVHVDELAQAEAQVPARLEPARYFLLAATGDEVLDWSEMRERYAGCRQRIIEGGDHGLSEFADWLPEVLAFALSDTSPGAARTGLDAAPRVVVGNWAQLAAEAMRIRTEVFVHEQFVSPDIELDQWDADCEHALAYIADGRAVGTGRLLPDGHIGRMAVRAPWRGCGVGSALLTALIAKARQRGDQEVILAAQLRAVPFYARHGFVAQGETFMDAGIEHVMMRHRLLQA